MSGKRAKALRKEYRHAADKVIQGDVKIIVDVLTKKMAKYRTLAVVGFSFAAMFLLMVVVYASNI
jgi:predicted alpha/beta-fold hydrolase